MTRMEPFRARRAGLLSGGMKQKLALMCTLLQPSRILFLDEPPTASIPFHAAISGPSSIQLSRRHHGLRHNRVSRRSRALQSPGPDAPWRMIRCDTSRRLKRPWRRPATKCEPHNSSRPASAATAEGVVSVEPVGARCTCSSRPARTSVEALQNKLNSQNLGPADFRSIAPSLEDVFIALIEKESR
jgi:ABC-type multidrug transport system ATPase subunit